MNTYSIPSVYIEGYSNKWNICNLDTLFKSGVVLVVPAVENTMVSVVFSLIGHKKMKGRDDTVSI